MAIPTVDLADFLSGDPARKSDFVQKLGKAYEEVGFVAVKNHGIPDELIGHLYQYVQEFFSLPLEQKKRYEIPELAGQRGYTSFGKEHAKGSDAPDLKEFFQYGQVPRDGFKEEEYPPNVQVEQVKQFNPTFENAYRAFEQSGKALLQAIALYLNLDEHYFDEFVHNGNSILRAIHYPPITQEPKSAIRAEQHEDINLITLLVGASADGLEILTKQNEWVPVTSLPEQIVVNVGDMLQRLTNNKLRSTTHRVVNPKRELWHTSRFSIPFFLHPKSSMSLRCLDSCIDEAHPKAYEDATAGEYLDERLREIGLKK
ncbi:MAG TPA: 2-oxoglutarate and iron-dependent oxygenase domain-containing protein [Ferruginibacter sp.]|nr:2-oxoglutarate and iron-dependent oxygenase domain-containing protein [Ferruginibacter sp.]HRO06594.1 2-oxoglutarate and iron-dependent oxygenase domain-containing protein [Ferruginibacter sp.]HRO96884.1 2-oxoglutarate and iron-dependent oxygenase domain-containing protein [Ferruginibacter sp.]HRP50081.1 2-oxoglutarate and iron-dependent oxygenase domain-containing protein [Ferruginibacter sp.]